MRRAVRRSLECLAAVPTLFAMTFIILATAHAGLDNELTLVDSKG